MSTEIKPGQRVVEIDCLERVGTVAPRDEWWDRAQVDRYPDHLVVRLPEGNLALIHPDRLVLVPTDQTTPTQDHGPLAATLSDRTLAKVLSRPAHVPLSEMKSTRVFGFNVVTISPQGIPGGPRLDGVVSRQRAQDELDELEPFMVDGWKTVMVELREVTS